MPGELNLNVPPQIGIPGPIQSPVTASNIITYQYISTELFNNLQIPESNELGVDRNNNNEIVLVPDDSTKLLRIVPILTISSESIDTSISELIQSKSNNGPVIVTQPTEYFRNINSEDYEPGQEIFIDYTNTIKVLNGSVIKLIITATSDYPETLKYEWKVGNGQTVSTSSVYIFNSSTFLKNEIFYCKVSDYSGETISDTINLQVIDTSSDNSLLTNLIKNSSGEEGTNNWINTGDNFNMLGSLSLFRVPQYAYHLSEYGTVNGQPNVAINEWYPRPEIFENDNPTFKGKINNKITFGKYFRGGAMNARDNFNNDISSLRKEMYQDIDVTNISDYIDGKIYGIPGITSVLFGWLGTRADQGDKCSVELEFYDQNSNLITVENPVIISSGGSIVTNMFRAGQIIQDEPLVSSLLWLGGTFGSYDYVGMYNTFANNYDKTVPLEFDSQTDQQRFYSYRTVVLGRKSDYFQIPIGTRKIRVYQKYWHIPLINPSGSVISPWDLVYTGTSPQGSDGIQYVSDALITGINLLAWPKGYPFEVNNIDVLKESGIII